MNNLEELGLRVLLRVLEGSSEDCSWILKEITSADPGGVLDGFEEVNTSPKRGGGGGALDA